MVNVNYINKRKTKSMNIYVRINLAVYSACFAITYLTLVIVRALKLPPQSRGVIYFLAFLAMVVISYLIKIQLEKKYPEDNKDPKIEEALKDE